MNQAFIYVFSIFGNFISLIFNDFTFTALNYTVSFGWLILGGILISMVIGSILNIPSSLPDKEFYSKGDYFQRKTGQVRYQRNVGKYAKYKDDGGNF